MAQSGGLMSSSSRGKTCNYQHPSAESALRDALHRHWPCSATAPAIITPSPANICSLSRCSAPAEPDHPSSPAPQSAMPVIQVGVQGSWGAESRSEPNKLCPESASRLLSRTHIQPRWYACHPAH
ncbi:hypothetical protein AOLI_G00120970 [Acnodon oligacanthus]